MKAITSAILAFLKYQDTKSQIHENANIDMLNMPSEVFTQV
jgi:hypothetical protein